MAYSQEGNCQALEYESSKASSISWAKLKVAVYKEEGAVRPRNATAEIPLATE